MISRRNIRSKVMQCLYSQELMLNHPATPDADLSEKNLSQQFNQSQALLVYLAWCITEIAQYAEKEAYKRAGKLIPTYEDLNVNTKIAGNEIIWKIKDDATFQAQINIHKPWLKTDETAIKGLFTLLRTSEEYKKYITAEGRETPSEKSICMYILSDVLLANESFDSTMEELFTNWNDDGEMIAQHLSSFIQKPKLIQFNSIIDQEKLQFAKMLLRTVIEKENYLVEVITPKLKNWDPDRIAQLDMILMKMGLAEFLYFETIPPKVTINEYIDLGKEYSTSQSGHFINGILDSIHKELVAAGKMEKLQYKKM